MPIDRFRAAQNRILQRFGIEADCNFIHAPVVAGRAQVLVTGDGPPVVLINGIGTPAAMWAPLMAHLNGFTLLAIDLPGYGLTDTTPDLTKNYRSTAVRFLKDSLDQLGLGEAMFVANSLGSLWTLWLALDQPERVVSMVHVGCPALVLGTSAPLPMRLLSVPWLARAMMKLQPPSARQVEQLAKMVRQHPLSTEVAEVLLATERLPGFEATFLATLHTLIQLRGARSEMALTADELAGVAQPTQLIWGNNDPMGSPAVGRRVAAALPDAELHMVEGGHAPWLTRADVIGRTASSFLRRSNS